MRFRTVLVIFSVVSTVDGLLAILAPGPFLHAIWPEREVVGAELFVQGWGACLLALAALAWTHRHAQDPFLCKSIALALFVYFGVAAALWFADARVIGWTLMSAAMFIFLSGFASAFGYLRFSTMAGVHRF